MDFNNTTFDLIIATKGSGKTILLKYLTRNIEHEIIYDPSNGIDNRNNHENLNNCLDNRIINSSDEIIKFKNENHYIITLQYCIGLSPEFREKIRYVYIFPIHIINYLRKVFDNFNTGHETFTSFKNILLNNVTDRKYLRIDNFNSESIICPKVNVEIINDNDYEILNR